MSIRQTLVRIAVIAAAAGVAAQAVRAQDAPHAFVGATIIPIAGEEIWEGTLIVQHGKITAVGRRDDVPIPPGAVEILCAERVIMPGLICTHSHLGGVGGADSSAPIQPDIRIYDSINVRDSGFRRAVAGGLTTLNIMPGSGHLLSGQTLYLKLRADAQRIEDWFIRNEDGSIAGGVKMANGTNSQREKPFPETRGKSAALVREQFVKAQDYRAKMAAAAGDATKTPPRDLGLEMLGEVLDRKRVVHHHTHRQDDIMTVLRLAEEFNFRVVLHHVSEGWMVAEQIAAARVPCSIILVDSPGGKLEARNLVYETGGILERAGVLTAYHTDDWITDSRLFLRMAALGVRAGMSREAALRAVTLSGAEILDLGGRIGSLEAGKDADFVILTSDPFSVATRVLETWVEGRRVFNGADPQDRLYAVGGYGAGRDATPYLCCCEE